MDSLKASHIHLNVIAQHDLFTGEAASKRQVL
jgi:hypothetical protein